ncbi:MAG: NAD(P)/FAD-dependent oxidoreductase [Spirochaetales bacterium]|nr:MAG: NAD(P)/FAD-dependent oxidoreductase [Spirochaetales bacterium]
MPTSIIIIGGGIAGLSAGCYGRMNGFDTQIIEMHDKPGGQCTAWKRKEYTFDGCIQWLTGSAPPDPYYDLWEEIGAVQGREFVYYDEFIRVEGLDGRALILYTDMDRLNAHMRELSPEDGAEIDGFTGAVKLMSSFTLPVDRAPELSSVFDTLGMIPNYKPLFPVMKKFSSLTLLEFAERFKSPFLREALPLCIGIEDFSLLGLMFTLAGMYRKTSGYPLGGSLEFSKNVEKRYLDLGGKISYKTRAEKIICRKNRAVGVTLASGEELFADYVLSACDGHETIFELLDGKYADRKIRAMYEELPLFPPILWVSLGVAKDFSGEPHSGILMLPEPIETGGSIINDFAYQHRAYDPSLAPAGKSTLSCMIETSYEFWENLYNKDRDAYRAEKEKIAETVIGLFERRFPGTRQAVETVDVATPMTYVRYTHVWRGAWEGFSITPKTMRLKISKTLPGLKNFYLIGQWVVPGGGLPTGLKTGRDVIQLICARERKPFSAKKP